MGKGNKMAKYIDIEDERFWKIMFDEACVEGQQADRIQNELEKIAVEPKRGEFTLAFTEEENVWKCSVCDKYWLLNDGTPFDNEMNFCPRCGADMRKKVKCWEDEEDDRCYECTGYGDDHSYDEDGELVSNCPDCPWNRVNDEW